MKVLFVNPIIYTPENAHIPQIDSIDDTMSYDLCMAFQRHGVDITLAAAPRKMYWFSSVRLEKPSDRRHVR